MVGFNFQTWLFSMILLNLILILISKNSSNVDKALDHCLLSPNPSLPRCTAIYLFDIQHNSWDVDY